MRSVQQVSGRVRSRLKLMYYQYYFLPKLDPGEKRQKIRSIKFAYNTLHILTDRFFYKVGIKYPNTIASEYDNYEFAYASYPVFRQYIPVYVYKKTGRISAIKIEKLFPMPDEAENQEAASAILQILKS